MRARDRRQSEMGIDVTAAKKTNAAHHRWDRENRVERDGVSEFEKLCSVCGCIARNQELWTQTSRNGEIVSATMRKVLYYRPASMPFRADETVQRDWRESRPPCTGAKSKPSAKDVAAGLAAAFRAKGAYR